MKHRPKSAESRARGLGGRVGGGHDVPDARDCFRKKGLDSALLGGDAVLLNDKQSGV